MSEEKKPGKPYLAIVLDFSDHSHTEITVRASDSVEASRMALVQRIRDAEIYDAEDFEDGEDPTSIVQGDEAGSSCEDYSADETAGFAVIAVFDVDDLQHLLKEMERC
jgi:hypothetical protein